MRSASLGGMVNVDIQISVVCAVRNARHTIDSMLSSYRRERSTRTELIIVDAVSTDGTLEVLHANNDCIDQLISEPDQGIYDAWNKGIALSRGRYVAFIGADDRIAGRSLEVLCDTCMSNPRADFIHGFNVLTRSGIPVRLLGRSFDRRRMMRRMLVAHVLAAHRRDWLDRLGGFDISYRSAADYDLLLRAVDSAEVLEVAQVLAYVETGGISLTGSLPFRETYRAQVRNGSGRLLAGAMFLRGMAGWMARRTLEVVR